VRPESTERQSAPSQPEGQSAPFQPNYEPRWLSRWPEAPPPGRFSR
jgi:hypothetical protein